MRKVEASAEVNCSAITVFNAFIEPHQLKGWWNAERCLVEAKQGGVYSLAWNISKQGFQYISTGVITVFNPGKELFIDHFVYFNPDRPILGPTYLAVKLEEINSSTRVRLVQGGYQMGGEWDWFYEAVTEAWPKVLQNLKQYLEAK
jgi:uncharacterized protein YndB with AHSA1/START domain